jgi:NOL1/NOP2/sun family putative RNA methylase
MKNKEDREKKEGLPQAFIERLKNILPAEHFAVCLKTFSEKAAVTVRVNTLKNTIDEMRQAFAGRNVAFSQVLWCAEAFSLANISVIELPLDKRKLNKELGETDLIKKGYLYVQNLASMVPVLVLDPHPGERVLDLCAAPGSKASHIAARMQNQGQLICVENIKPRFYKLKSVLTLLGVDIAEVKCLDGRRYGALYARDACDAPGAQGAGELFDRVLVDAPCSSEGRFKTDKPKTFFYWSPRKIKEMSHKQKGLLLNAGRLLKTGGVLVYSTCTFSPEENEAVVDWFLRKTEGRFRVEPVSLQDIKTYPALCTWQGREYDPQVRNCLRILPTEKMEGFFIAKIIKLA